MTNKELRYSIMKIATGKYRWNYDEFHELMEEWGFGNSLRKLKRYKLIDLRNELLGIQDYNIPEEFQLDKQGMYMYSLMKQAGWTMRRVNLFCIKKYLKSHWNLLIKSEKRAVINMLRRYRSARA